MLAFESTSAACMQGEVRQGTAPVLPDLADLPDFDCPGRFFRFLTIPGFLPIVIALLLHEHMTFKMCKTHKAVMQAHPRGKKLIMHFSCSLDSRPAAQLQHD